MASPVLEGTLWFVLATVTAWVGAGVLLASRRLAKEDVKICIVLVPVATVSMWLMWVVAWMHQWHPLIRPTLPPLEEST